MAIHALLERERTEAGVVFDPEDIEPIVAAFEMALIRLKVDDRKSKMAFLVAKTTIQFAKTGEREPQRLCDHVVRLYRKPSSV